MEFFDVLLAESLNGSGGGGGDITPILSVKLVNATASNISDIYYIELANNHVFSKNIILLSGQETNIDCLVEATEDEGDVYYEAYFPLSGTTTVTDMVNCTSVIGDWEAVITITDPTQNASCTINYD